jgi:hypothetical protein
VDAEVVGVMRLAQVGPRPEQREPDAVLQLVPQANYNEPIDMRDSLKTVVAWFCTAWFGVTTVSPPLLHHSHPGGDRPHSHDGSLDDDHRGSINWSDEKGFDDLDHCDHLHVSILGLNLTIPASSASFRNCLGQPSAQLELPQYSFDSRSLEFVGLALGLKSSPLACGVEGGDCGPLQAFIQMANPHLLCDTARHERSGVQLS